jgi:cyanate permease
MSHPRPDVSTMSSAAEAHSPRRASSVPLRIFAACTTSVVVAVGYTNYGPLIPLLSKELHINAGQAGLLSTFLFLGLAVMYIPAGALTDSFGPRPVLVGFSIVLVLGGVLLPLVPNLTWILACRMLIGFGAGGTFVAGAGVAASLGKYAPVGQGLYGGSVQIGSGLGLLLTPQLAAWFNWQGAFLCWGLLGIASIIVWLLVDDGFKPHERQKIDVRAGLRSPAVWSLGLSHMGTFGLGNAIAAWIAVYLAHQYGLSLGLAATLGSIALLSGVFFRPLGGILTALGMAVIAIGATIPYTSVFNEAAHLKGVGKGIAQGLVSMISTPTVLLGPPLIGFLFQHSGSITLAFSSILLFAVIAITASFLAGPAVRRETLNG